MFKGSESSGQQKGNRSHLTYDMEEERSLFEIINSDGNSSELITNRANSTTDERNNIEEEGGRNKRRASLDDLDATNQKRSKIFGVDDESIPVEPSPSSSNNAPPAAALAWDYNDFSYSNSIPMGMDDSFYQANGSSNRPGLAEMDLLAQLGAALNEHTALSNTATSSSLNPPSAVIDPQLDPQLFPSVNRVNGKEDEATYGGNSRDAVDGMVRLFGEGDRELDLVVSQPKAAPKKRAPKGKGKAVVVKPLAGIEVNPIREENILVKSVPATITKPIASTSNDISSTSTSKPTSTSTSTSGVKSKPRQATSSTSKCEGPTENLNITSARDAAAAFAGSDGNPHNCPVEGCDKTFTRKSDFLRHYRIHTQERPFACDFTGCGKDFIQRSALTVHARTHTGDKPHNCVDCQREFADSSSLARHRKVHAGIKPYKCPNCGTKAFSRKATLQRHAAVCSGDINSTKKARSINRRPKADGSNSVTPDAETTVMQKDQLEEDEDEEDEEEEGSDHSDLVNSIIIAAGSGSNSSNNLEANSTSNNSNSNSLIDPSLSGSGLNRVTPVVGDGTSSAKATSATRTEVRPVPKPSSGGISSNESMEGVTEEEAIRVLIDFSEA